MTPPPRLVSLIFTFALAPLGCVGSFDGQPDAGGTTDAGSQGAPNPSSAPGAGGSAAGISGSGGSGGGASVGGGSKGGSAGQNGSRDAAGPPSDGCVGACGSGGMGADAAVTVADAGADPFSALPHCTSGTMWTNGTRGSAMMQPGEACIACHSQGRGPRLAFGGTVYPSAHEPSECNGADGNVQVVVTDSTGASVTAVVNSAGNFYSSQRTVLTPPLKAKVVYMGRERAMVEGVPVGDCNGCHTQDGTTTVSGGVKAPGRILLP